MGAELVRRASPSGRRNLIIVRAGEGSLHPRWLTPGARRSFDLLVSYYGPVAGAFAEDGDLYHAERGTRWPVHHALLQDHPDLLEGYDRVCFACDDLDADMKTWDALFAACAEHDLDLAQPAILGPISYAITAPVEDVAYRSTNFVENMCPVFSARALRVCHSTFAESISGWGLNHVWPLLLRPRGWRLGIIDEVRVTHTRPVGVGSLYERVSEAGVRPLVEMRAVMARYGIEKIDIRTLEYVKRTFAQRQRKRLGYVAARMKRTIAECFGRLAR